MISFISRNDLSRMLPYIVPRTLCILASCIPVFSAADIKQPLDWVPYEQLTEQQRQRLTPGSCGAYISPIANDNVDLDITQLPLETSSNSSHITEIEGKRKVTLIGDVLIKQGYRQLSSNQAMYDESNRTITIDGELTLRDTDLLLLANKGVASQTKDMVVIDDATYVIHSAHIRGTGEKLSKEQQVLKIQKGSLTYCEPGNDSWDLKGSKIVIDTESNQGYATNVRITVKDIPVFYWPYLRFPVGDERQSGFLFPSIASSNGGTNISIPYYFNLAPNYDLILTPHLIEAHGALLEAEARHLSQQFDTEVIITHLSNDTDQLTESNQSLIDNGSLTLAEATRNRGNDRWLTSLNQTGGKNQRWSTLINYSQVSDNDYLDDFDNVTLGDSTEISLKQQINVAYAFDHWKLAIDNTRYQVLDNNITRPYKQLPEITLNGLYNWYDWELRMDNEWTRFAHSDSDHAGNTRLIGNRARLKYSLQLNNEAEYGFFNPRVQFKHLSYSLDQDRLAITANNSPSITVPQAVIDTGLFFERSGNRILQTFEPRLFYFYSAFEDQSNITGDNTAVNFDTSDLTFSYSQLFNDTRFSGGDRIDDANQLSIGLTTRFINQQSGRELFSASLGKALYLDDRKVTLTGTPDTSNSSVIAGQINASVNNHLSINNSFLYDDNGNQVDENNLTLRYRDGSTLFNTGYRFLRNTGGNDTEQAEISAILPFSKSQWNFIAHYNYDMTNNRELKQLLGVEYSSCCYRARFAYKRFLGDGQTSSNISNLNYDEGIILEFQLLGLAGTGKRWDKVLDDSIDGYEQWKASYR